MKTAALFFLLLSTSAFAQLGAVAESITIPTSGGLTVLKHCKVTKVDPDGVRVVHDAGMAKVPYEYMPEGWALAAGIDRAVAQAYRQGMKDAAEAPASTPTTPNSSPSTTPASKPASKPIPLRVFGAVIKNRDTIPENCVPIRPLSGGVILVEGKMSAYANNPRFDATVYPTGQSKSYGGRLVPVYSMSPVVAAE